MSLDFLKFSLPTEMGSEKPNGFWLVSLDCQRAGHPRPAGRTTDEPQSYRNIPFMSTSILSFPFSFSVEISPSCEFRSICFRHIHFLRPPKISKRTLGHAPTALGPVEAQAFRPANKRATIAGL